MEPLHSLNVIRQPTVSFALLRDDFVLEEFEDTQIAGRNKTLY